MAAKRISIKPVGSDATRTQPEDKKEKGQPSPQLNKEFPEAQGDYEIIKAELGARRDEVARLTTRVTTLEGDNAVLNGDNIILQNTVQQLKDQIASDVRENQKVQLEPIEAFVKAYDELVTIIKNGNSVKLGTNRPEIQLIILDMIKVHYDPK